MRCTRHTSRKEQTMRRIIPLSIVALASAALAVGAFALISPGGSKTVVRQVAVAGAQPAASTSNLSVTGVYNQARDGVVEITVKSTAPTARRVPVRRRLADPAGAGLRLRLRRQRPHRHEPARRRRRSVDLGPLLERRHLPRDARRVRPVDRHRGDQGRRAGVDAAPARARRLRLLAGRPGRRRDRQPVRSRGDRHEPASSAPFIVR